jgi:hypothetical protein
MSKKEKNIELIPDSGPSGWKIKHGNNVGNGPSDYPKVDFQPNSGPHLVVFKITDNAVSSSATFNATDPMWLQKGNTSPSQQGFDPQITDWAIFDGGKTLVLLDSNTKAGDMSYRVKADGYAPILDPIIRNGGTTTPPSMTPWSTGDIVTAGLALLIAFVAGILVNRYVMRSAGTAAKV